MTSSWRNLILRFVPRLLGLITTCCMIVPTWAWSPTPVSDDPLLRMPGTQPGQVQLEPPDQCHNCHADYDLATEPWAWQGSMMGQAARDPLFWAAMTVAAQDSIWAIGRPNATDLCLRCHFPQGWLEGRSDPTNASLMQGSDYDGVHCGHCHRMVDPMFDTAFDGTRESDDWEGYWDESNRSDTPSSAAALATFPLDEAASEIIELFNGNAFFDPETNRPHSADFDENGAGQYFIDPNQDRRGPFADANASHAMVYSRYHKSRFFCSTCHDVSNAVLANIEHADVPPGDGTTVLPTEQISAYSYAHVERTFSEFALSAYGRPGGAPGSGAYAPESFNTSLENNYIARCQDCHLPDVPGRASSQSKALNRPDGSTEHVHSAVPSHDMTGGNYWVPRILASTVSGSPNFDSENQSLLGQGAQVLTLDLREGLGLDPAGLLAAADRALENLRKTATIEDAVFETDHRSLTFRVRNHTGHKLLSGFPEGRRAWVNIRMFDDAGVLLEEVNPYDSEAATLKGLNYPYSDPDAILPTPEGLGPSERYEDALVYEMTPQSSLTGEEHTFHFVLADRRYKDNRIPPRGFRIADASDRLVDPVWSGSMAPEFFTEEEYAGGYDEIEISVGAAVETIEIRLFYQTTSREYVEFLRDEINGSGNTLPGNGVMGDPAYLAQTDVFFSQLRAWGDTIWQLWRHNRNVPGAAPILMTEQVVTAPAVQNPSIDIEKATNGYDADAAPGPYVPVGAAMTWTYRVTNSGDTNLSAVHVSDSDTGVTVNCPRSELAPGGFMDCTANGVATAAQYANIGYVTATPPDDQPEISDSDPSHYFGAVPSVDIEVSTNDIDADEEPGLLVLPGESLNWIYRVINTGNVALNQITVSDSQGVSVSCPGKFLDAGARMNCAAAGIATAGQYSTVGTVSATPPDGLPNAEDSDPSHYFGVVAAIDLEKATNGEDADVVPGPLLQEGDPVTWTYTVRNLSNIDLSNIFVNDDQGLQVDCPTVQLAAGAQMACTATGTVQSGQYRNVGTASGQPPIGSIVEDSDPSHYFGEASEDVIFVDGFE